MCFFSSWFPSSPFFSYFENCHPKKGGCDRSKWIEEEKRWGWGRLEMQSGREERGQECLWHTLHWCQVPVWHLPAVSSTWWMLCVFAVSPGMLVLCSCHGFSPSSFWWLAVVVYFWVTSVPPWFHGMSCLFLQVGLPKNEQMRMHNLLGPPVPVLGGELEGAPAFCLQLTCTFHGLLETPSPPLSMQWEEINLRWYTILCSLQHPIHGQLRNRKEFTSRRYRRNGIDWNLAWCSFQS